MTRLLVTLAFVSLLLAPHSHCPGSSPPDPAGAETPMDAVAAHDWDQANAMAAQYADPVAAKLVTYYRLLTRGQAEHRRNQRLHAEQPRLAAAGPAGEPLGTGAGRMSRTRATALAQCQSRWPSRRARAAPLRQRLRRRPGYEGRDRGGAAGLDRHRHCRSRRHVERLPRPVGQRAATGGRMGALRGAGSGQGRRRPRPRSSG